MTSVRELKLLHDELKRRFPDLAKKHYDFIDYSFKRQAEILQDPARFQAWLFTRRFGKSTTFAKKGCGINANNPGSKTLFLALTLDSAKGIILDAVEKELNEKKVPLKLYEREGIFDFKNGSMFRCFGVDSNYKEMKKILGQAYDLVGLDESGSMTIDVETLIMQMILAALVDRMGSLVMLGTAENIPNTFYQKVTEGKHTDLDWSIYKGHTSESPYTGPGFEAEKARLVKNNPNVIHTSWFRTHWLNEWCADDDLLIIRHSEHLNETTLLPSGEVFYCLGVDLGFNDASSFSVCAYSRNDPNLYVLESFKLSGMDFTDVAGTIRNLQGLYPFYKIIVDGANKQGVEELRKRHQLPLVNAEKTDKATFLRALSDDYKQGRILVHKDKCKALIEEQSKLMWIKDTDKEDPRCENHCNDSLLYAWRECRNYMFQPEFTEWKSEEQKMNDQWEEERKQALSEAEEMNLLF